MRMKIKSILFISLSCILLSALSACAVPNKNNTKNDEKVSSDTIENKNIEIDLKAIAIIEPYHDVILDIDSKEFITKGFEVGDMTMLSFKDSNGESYEMLSPICDYYNQVNRDDTAIVIDNEKVKIAMHNLENEGFADVYNVGSDDIVYHIEMNKKKGYDIDKFVLDTFDFEETTSVNNCKKMLDEYDNIYIVCKGIASDELDMNFYVTKDYVMIETSKFSYFTNGNREARYKDGNKVSEVTYEEYNDRFNTDILHFDSEEVINKKVENNNLIIRTKSTDLKELPKLHILPIDSFMSDGPNTNIRLEKVYTFDKDTRRLISYDSYLCKDDKQDLHLQKVSGIFSNVRIPNYCVRLIKAMNADINISTSSNASNNIREVIVIKATASNAALAPYNQETIASQSVLN